ncbi:hypothetical protein LCGC14_2647830 [marine sediment metagenome]|uniref:Uncharacterized protein n=1 Tax=marine sediment metagenome TaxID=412755 RepID=A0A0F9CMT3_9ZZZZ
MTDKELDEFIEGILREINVTGNIDGGAGPPRTPGAFTKKTGKEDKDLTGYFGGAENDGQILGYTKARKEDRIHFEGIHGRVMKELLLGEGAYHDYRNDSSLTPKQKMGTAIKNIRDGIREARKVVRMNARLKKEVGIKSVDYWKRSHTALNKTQEDMLKLATELRELGE